MDEMKCRECGADLAFSEMFYENGNMIANYVCPNGHDDGFTESPPLDEYDQSELEHDSCPECPHCGGSGMEDDTTSCDECDGEGVKWWMC